MDKKNDSIEEEKTRTNNRSAKSNWGPFLWLLFLCLVLIVWFYVNVSGSSDIDPNRFSHFIDPVSKQMRKPSDLVDLAKVINITAAYINSTNAQERLYDLEFQLNLENPFKIDHDYSREDDLIKSGWPHANQAACGQQLQWIIDKLNKHQNYTLLRGQLGYELTNYMDTFGQPGSGLYSGVLVWPGSYKFCRQSHLDNGNIKTGRYCFAKFKPRWWPKSELAEPATTIRVGICLPQTCDTLSFQHYGSSIETLTKHDMPEFYRDNLQFHSMFCLPDEESPIRQIPLAGYIYLYVVVGWVLLVLVCTILHELIYKRKRRINNFVIEQYEDNNNSTKPIKFNHENTHSPSKEKTLKEDLLEAMSMRFSLNTFKTNTFLVNYRQGHRVRVNLGVLDFFKVSMTLLVILGHSAYLTEIYARSLQSRVYIKTRDIARLSLSISRCVDTFFVIFGLLTTFTLMRKLNSKRISNPLIWVGLNFGVFLKITPIFMLVYCFSKFVSPYIGSGPWWDYGVDKLSLKGVCMSEPWWKSIPYFGSFGMIAAPACVLPGWFLVGYAQISLLLPLITYLMCRLPNYAYKVSIVACLLVVSASSIGLKLYNQTSIRAEGFGMYGAFVMNLLEKFQSSGYMTSLGRLGSVTVGCFVGYLLRLYDDGKISSWSKWLKSHWTLAIATLITTIIVLLPIAGSKFGMVSLEQFVLSNVVLIIAWPILISILFMNTVTVNNHKVIMRFFSHTFFHVFNRLALIIFLIHWEIMFITITNFEQGPSYGFFTDVFKLWCMGAVLSIFFAFIIYILIEAPLTRLLLIIVERKKQPQI